MRYGIVTLVIVFLVILGAVTIFGRGGSSSKQPVSRHTKLVDYANNDGASISWTQQGRLVGEDQRKAVRVTVTKSTRKVEILDGYAQRVEKVQEYANSQEAFDSFTRALDGYNFGQERKVAQSDERGVCPAGNRFIYRLSNNAEEVMRSWSTSCRNTEGNFGGGAGNRSQIARLFKLQITDYQKFVSGVRF